MDKNNLEVLKELIQTWEQLENRLEKLERVGVELQGFCGVQLGIEKTIRLICNMPKDDELGVFIFDIFYDDIQEYFKGRLELDAVVGMLYYWKEHVPNEEG